MKNSTVRSRRPSRVFYLYYCIPYYLRVRATAEKSFLTMMNATRRRCGVATILAPSIQMSRLTYLLTLSVGLQFMNFSQLAHCCPSGCIALSRALSRNSSVRLINGHTLTTECLTSDIFSMLLCGVSDCIIVFSIVLAP